MLSNPQSYKYKADEPCCMWSMKSAALLAVTLWVLMLIYISTQLFGMQTKPTFDDEKLVKQLGEAIGSLNELKKQNENLKTLIEAERKEHDERRKDDKKDREKLLLEVKAANEVRSKKGTVEKETEKVKEKEETTKDKNNEDLYSMEHEEARREVDRRIWEMFYYLHKNFNSILKNEIVGNHTENQLISMLASSHNLSAVDGGIQWRKKSLQKLTDHIQGKIDKLQNPEDCKKTRALICSLDKECGFGCQLHHVAYCFVTAFGENRTLILQSDGDHWRYSKKGWTGAFLPVTKCSYSKTVGENGVPSFTIGSKERVVRLGVVDGLITKPLHLPLSFPISISNQLRKLHSNPPAFFISQFIWYLMRSNEEFNKSIQEVSKMIPFGKGPIVGLQVRRTDKVGTEAAFHSVEEYMTWAEIWFKVQDRIAGKNVTRRVYIASDDPKVIPEARQKYPSYDIFGDTKIADTAQLHNRYTDSSLHGVVTDIRLLSQCDYLVCTFSSQVCRMGFELMQVLQGDAGERFHSLDDLYYYGGQHPHEQTAVEDHVPESSNEIELKVGDTIGVAGNHWDGYSKGTNRRTGQNGLYPSYKVVEKWRILDFPALL